MRKDKLKWAIARSIKGSVRLGRDRHGWVRAIVLKEARWVCIAPLGTAMPVKEVCGHKSVNVAKKAAQVLFELSLEGRA